MRYEPKRIFGNQLSTIKIYQNMNFSTRPNRGRFSPYRIKLSNNMTLIFFSPFKFMDFFRPDSKGLYAYFILPTCCHTKGKTCKFIGITNTWVVKIYYPSSKTNKDTGFLALCDMLHDHCLNMAKSEKYRLVRGWDTKIY